MEVSLDLSNIAFLKQTGKNILVKNTSKDFYTRNNTKQNFDYRLTEISDDVSKLISSIETAVFTNKKQVFGQELFGINLEECIFTLNLNERIIKTKIENVINSYCPLSQKYSVNVGVTFFKTESRDVCYVEIFINDERSLGIVL